MTISLTRKKETWAYMALLVIAIMIAYYKIFNAGFISWDDGEYVIHNNDIKGLSLEFIANWFSHFYIGNYHPLTMCSYAIDFALGSKSPLTYHLTNLLLHTLNALALFAFVARLQPNKLIAFFVALIFAVHPIQTESVSWIAERKTVLFAFFYLLALIQYTSYLSHPAIKKLLLVYALGIAAVLSKGAAVTLPLSLFCVDIWMKRDFGKAKTWLEKIPLLFFALVFGIVAIKAQSADKFLDNHADIGGFDTLVFAAYAYVQYIIRLFVPVNLSVIYPYPAQISFIFYIYLVVAAGVITLGIVSYRKGWNILCGGILFYTINIALVLQFIQFGNMLMADRYLYIASIGIIFPAVYYLFVLAQKLQKPIIATLAGASVSVFLLSATFVRNEIWLSDLNFYTSIVEAYPNSAVAQYSMGALYTHMGDYAKAETYLNAATSIDPGNYKAWYNKGVLYHRQGNVVEALDALSRCIAIKPYPKAYFSRALIYETTGQPDLAISDIDIVLADQPANARAWYIKADCMDQKNNASAALDYYNKAISYDSADPLFFIRRGLLYAKINQLQPALADLNNAINLNPGNGEALYYRGIMTQKAGADPCPDLKLALSRGYKPARQAIDRFCK